MVAESGYGGSLWYIELLQQDHHISFFCSEELVPWGACPYGRDFIARTVRTELTVCRDWTGPDRTRLDGMRSGRVNQR